MIIKRQSMWLLICLPFNLLGQQKLTTNPCFTIKYLDFFGLEEMPPIKWPDSELEGLLKMDFKKTSHDSTVKTNFIVPMIVMQLKDYHPNCTSKIDTAYFEKLASIYLKIREIDSLTFANLSVLEKINYIRNDFYLQAEDPKILPYLIYTLDDGPYLGEDLPKEINLTDLNSRNTDFGKIGIARFEKVAVFVGFDSTGVEIWRKKVKKGFGRYLSEIQFVDDPIFKSSLGTIVNMISEGEVLRLFLKNDGSFMFYFHSW